MEKVPKGGGGRHYNLQYLFSSKGLSRGMGRLLDDGIQTSIFYCLEGECGRNFKSTLDGILVTRRKCNPLQQET